MRKNAHHLLRLTGGYNLTAVTDADVGKVT